MLQYRTDTNCTASGTVTCLSCVPLLSVIANKTTLLISDLCPMCLFVTSTVAKPLTALPTVQVTLLQTKCTIVVTVDTFPHSWYVYFGVTSLNAIWNFFWHWYRQQKDVWNMNCFLLGQLGKIFQSTSDPKRGRIFLSFISVLLLKFLYGCPIFPCNLILFFPKLLNSSFPVYAIRLLVFSLSLSLSLCSHI